MRDLQMTLLEAGGIEILDVETGETIYASDSDEEFGEEFPDLLDENDVEHALDFLEEKGVCTTRELEAMEVLQEPPGGFGDPGDDDDDDDDESVPWADDGDIIDGEVIEHE